ncbi:undecaprenyldiphospho-muramoylpentapeptide beta-N-acetylglucosaminyltransferase [Candidatus Tachikawaea gelatinosa]|uniref:UDP-N-acetylglucosamine--N-acetylmuramyl-(pentapeptide) pyrophosphoryl-undecaprenol N-acetylglucosamine transferase n=1 Tax=Candidatus Tachikawaea gelatinosa TaxID=1410383 RepID=A0A090ARN3_9ENTR|nr:undecaprenyldiphospho-muramoylpentapeptide beta-N-acetylglucosaminyltransferase [Candidatus Tachikawaea gelatinosa]BAP58460.1 UDP-N-acetylglucosamine--N-acetylmuramyl-(pentapeptide) pyrophosphoryl-undecaprenol N-acetylglucosamine transferase [Candidatus Tachikawaea gelatinosa]
MNKKRLMIVAGGTGGHIFPGLAVAHFLIKQGWEIRWLGTSNRIESKIVPKNGININYFDLCNYNKKNIKSFISSIIGFFRAWKKSREIMKKWKPNIVLGMGSYISIPGILAAWSYNIPTIVHEQNSIAGLSNKFLKNFSSKVIQAFPTAFSETEVVGNPIRDSLLSLPHPKKRFEKRVGRIRVLIIGGSQGAEILNNIIPKLALKMKNYIKVWHQVGTKNFIKIKNDYRINCFSLHYKITKFIHNMEDAYAWADLIIARAGALTVSEIATVGLAAIFIPFKHKNRHQYFNAKILERVGAAKILDSSHLTVELIEKILKNVNRKNLLEMAQKSLVFSMKNSTAKFTKAIINTLK